MADTMYAWSDILVEKDESGQNVVIKCGEKVSEGDVGEESYASMVEGGSLRPYPYPDTGDPNVSPVEHLRAEQAKLATEEERLMVGLAAMAVERDSSVDPEEEVERQKEALEAQKAAEEEAEKAAPKGAKK